MIREHEHKTYATLETFGHQALNTRTAQLSVAYPEICATAKRARPIPSLSSPLRDPGPFG